MKYPYEVHVIRPYTRGVSVVPIGNEERELYILQGLVGGYIQLWPTVVTYQGKERRCYVNEDGIASRLPLNEAAQAITGYIVLGPLVIVMGEES